MTTIRSDLYAHIAVLSDTASTDNILRFMKAYVTETYPLVNYEKLQLEIINYKERDDDRHYHLQELVFSEQEFETHYPELYI